MRKAHKAARSMSLEHGLENLSVPLHPGAVRFWSEKGMHIPSILLPRGISFPDRRSRPDTRPQAPKPSIWMQSRPLTLHK